MDIIGIDSSVVDYIVSIDRLPKRDEEIWMHNQSWQGGGKIATAMVSAARLGGKVGVLGITGDDVFGSFIVNDLKYHNVDTSYFFQEKGKDGCYCISLAEKTTAGRSFIGKLGTHRAYRPSDINPEYVKASKCVHLYQFSDADIAVVEIAKKHGIIVSFDGDAYDDNIVNKMNLIDIFIGSEFFYMDMFSGRGTQEENCRKISSMGPQIVIFTFGGQGCCGYDKKNGYFELPAFKVNVLDTTGAGDVFHGAFLYAYICEKMETKEAARFASGVSAIKCEYLGGRAGIPNRRMIQDFLMNGIYDSSELNERVVRYASFGC